MKSHYKLENHLNNNGKRINKYNLCNYCYTIAIGNKLNYRSNNITNISIFFPAIVEKVKYYNLHYINIILAFYDNDPSKLDDTHEFEFSDKIIILKRVKSLRQLKITEKELVKLCYKEAIIKGFTLKGIQQYIASKTKIWVEWSCLEYLKKAEEQENKEWYLRLAKDHFSYIGIHR
jgi:hypothetical protein